MANPAPWLTAEKLTQIDDNLLSKHSPRSCKSSRDSRDPEQFHQTGHCHCCVGGGQTPTRSSPPASQNPLHLHFKKYFVPLIKQVTKYYFSGTQDSTLIKQPNL